MLNQIQRSLFLTLTALALTIVPVESSPAHAASAPTPAPDDDRRGRGHNQHRGRQYVHNNSRSHVNVSPFGLTIGSQDRRNGSGFSVTIPFAGSLPYPYQPQTFGGFGGHTGYGYSNYRTHYGYGPQFGSFPGIHSVPGIYAYPGSVYDRAFADYGFSSGYRSPYFNDPLQPQTAMGYTDGLAARNFDNGLLGRGSSGLVRNYEAAQAPGAQTLIPTLQDAREHQLIAEAAFRSGNYLEAAMHANEALVIDKDNGLLMLFASQANFAAGYFANAVNELQNASRFLDDSQLSYIVRNYRSFYGRDDYVGQMDRLNDHLTRNPRDHWALTLRGFQFGALGYSEVASEDFARAQRVDPDFNLALRLDGVFGTGQLRPVIRVYTPESREDTAPGYQPLPAPPLAPEVEELPPPRIEGTGFQSTPDFSTAPPIVAPAGSSPDP